GIRDRDVTGVQTCALPISAGDWFHGEDIQASGVQNNVLSGTICSQSPHAPLGTFCDRPALFRRSESVATFVQLVQPTIGNRAGGLNTVWMSFKIEGIGLSDDHPHCWVRQLGET